MRLITSLAILALAGPAAAQTARATVQVDTTTVPRSFQGGAAGDDGKAAVAWKDSVQGIYCSTSDDAGQTWGPAVRVDVDGGLQTSKFLAFGSAEAIQMSGDHIYVIWEDVRDGVTNEIYFNRSIDGGQTFESGDQNLSQSSAMGYVWTLDQAMTVVREPDPGDDQIHVVYTVEDGVTANCDAGDPTNGPEDVFYTGSIDGGSSFASPILLSSAAGSGADVDELAICASGDRVYIAWIDSRDACFDDVYFTYSDDQGANWAPEIALETTGAGDASALTMDCDGLNVVVGWQEEPGVTTGPEEARIAVSTDGGVSFATDKLVGDYTPGTDDVDDFKVAYAFGNIVCVIVHDGAGTNDIYSVTSTDDGATFSSEISLTAGLGGSFPRITEGGAEVAVAWSGPQSLNAVEGVYSLDGGLTWSSTVLINDTPLSDTDFTEIGYDASKKNVIIAFLDDQGTGDNNQNVQRAGGFSIAGPGSATFRNGGTNPASYTASAPLLGDNFAASLDVGSTGNALGTIVGYLTPLTLPFQGRTILVNVLDPAGELLALPLFPGPIANIVVPIPNDPCLGGLSLSTQGIHVGTAPYALSNAQDLVIGAF